MTGADGSSVTTERRDHPAPDDLAPLTCNEIQYLFTALIARPVHGALHRLRWSQWQRRHQARPAIATTDDRRPRSYNWVLRLASLSASVRRQDSARFAGPELTACEAG